MTVAYLLLRYVLFGQVAREGQLTADGLALSRIFVGKHFQRMFFGGEVARYPGGYIAALLLTAGAWFLMRSSGAANLRHGPAMVLYFGPCWWFLCLAPLVVVGYESTRHVYLASVGWAIILGLVFHAIWHVRHAAFRYATLVASAGLFVFYTVGLQAEVAEWNVRARVSQKVVADLEREALAIPEGSLLIVGAPARSWEWSLPFAAQRPFTRTDLAERVSIVSPVLLDCCRDQWMERTQRIIRIWSQRESAPRGGTQVGCSNRNLLEVDGSRGPCAPESGDGAPRSGYVRSPGSSDVDDSPTGPLTRLPRASAAGDFSGPRSARGPAPPPGRSTLPPLQLVLRFAARSGFSAGPPTFRARTAFRVLLVAVVLTTGFAALPVFALPTVFLAVRVLAAFGCFAFVSAAVFMPVFLDIRAAGFAFSRDSPDSRLFGAFGRLRAPGWRPRPSTQSSAACSFSPAATCAGIGSSAVAPAPWRHRPASDVRAECSERD